MMITLTNNAPVAGVVLKFPRKAIGFALSATLNGTTTKTTQRSLQMDDDDDFCPVCMVEGQANCEEHAPCQPWEDEDDQELDGWHDEWERDNFGDS